MVLKTKWNSKGFLILTILLVLTNVLCSLFMNMEALRIVRVSTSLALYVSFLVMSFSIRRPFVLSLGLVLLADISLLNYENKWFCFLRFITFIVFNILLTFHIFKRQYIHKFKIIPTFVITILFIACLFMIEFLSKFFDFTLFGEVHQYLYYIYALSTLILILGTVIHSMKDYSRKIDLFLGAVWSFLVSDLLLIIGYYQNWYLAIQIERAFHILAIYLIINYVALLNRKQNKVEFI